MGASKKQSADKPTFAQETYASDLVVRLGERDHPMTGQFARSVLDCKDRWEMSKLTRRILDCLT